MKICVGALIRELREEKNLNQTELGIAVNMTQRKISYLENDKCDPNLDDIAVLCRFFNISADLLLGLPKGMPYPERYVRGKK